MEKFDHIAKRVGNFLECFAEIAMAAFGICLIGFVIIVLWQLFQALPIFGGSVSSYESVMENIIAFFLLFEFLAMAAAAMQNHGHLAADFLISLGITALLRELIAEHGAAMQNLLTSLAILALIVGEILMHWQNNREQHHNK